MSQIETVQSLAEILENCSDPRSRHWQSAWRELIKRYKKYIYKAILKRCRDFNNPHLNRQLSDNVDDIFNEVIINICRDNCKAIKEFRGRDNEPVFLAWLAKICMRTTYTYVNKHFIMPCYLTNFEDIKDYLGRVDSTSLLQLYEDHVDILRKCRKRSKALEQDINIFTLYVWEDFSLPMMQQIPCLKFIGHKKVDNVVHRFRKCLRKHKELLH